MTTKTFTWDWREQPPMDAIMTLVAEASTVGAVRMTMPDTGSDEYELVIESRAPELGAVAYEAAENAPLRERVTELEQQLDELRESLTTLAGEWTQDAADGDAEAHRPGSQRIVLDAAAKTLRVAAAELRKIAGLEDS